MKINVGSLNKAKVEACRRALAKYTEFSEVDVQGVEASSGVSEQPIGLAEIVLGAKNRARAAFEQGADLGIGLESGIFLVPETKSEYMDTTACAIFDGKTFHLGMSSCFEYPVQMIEKVLREGKSIGHAAVEMGFAENISFREGQGMIGVLTKGLVNRIDYSEQAVQMALIHLNNPEHY